MKLSVVDKIKSTDTRDRKRSPAEHAERALEDQFYDLPHFSREVLKIKGFALRKSLENLRDGKNAKERYTPTELGDLRHLFEGEETIGKRLKVKNKDEYIVSLKD